MQVAPSPARRCCPDDPHPDECRRFGGCHSPVGLPGSGDRGKNLLSGKAKIEPDSGYIFVNGSVRQAGLLLRLPDAETIAAYEKDWSEALAKVQAKYPKKLKAWQDRVETARLTGKAPPEPPIEPTPENFAISAIELRDPVGFGPQYAFAKAKDPDGFSYLMKVKPGRYVYYGQLFGAPSSGYFGTCYCMGTVAFDVKAGMITDTGNFFWPPPEPIRHFRRDPRKFQDPRSVCIARSQVPISSAR